MPREAIEGLCAGVRGEWEGITTVLTIGFFGAGIAGVAQQYGHVRSAQQFAVGDQQLDQCRYGAQVFGRTRGRRVGPQEGRPYAHAQVGGRHEIMRGSPGYVIENAQEVAQQLIVGLGQLIDNPANRSRNNARVIFIIYITQYSNCNNNNNNIANDVVRVSFVMIYFLRLTF